MFVRTLIGIFAGISLTTSAQAAIVNGDFSAVASLQGWSFLGNVTEQPDGITDDRAILDTTGSTATAGAVNSALGINLATVTTTIAGAGKTVGAVSVLYQNFTVIGVGELSFDWNFLTDEVGGLGSQPDFSFYVLQNVNELAQFSDTSAPGIGVFDRQTGFSTETITGLSAGNYLLGFGVVSVNNINRPSALLIDNVVLTDDTPTVPVPATAALLALGMMGLRRRKS
ncbi:MAG: hypothetical protein H6948_01825 [Zoogloeaceae bacterium]|nr:hypothetical protein [Zoogloeaceae bacterium]